MESSVLRPNHLEPSVDHRDSVVQKRSTPWVVRHNSVLTIATASLTPIVYLVFIDRFAVNAFFADDWSIIPMVHAAIHGHLALSQLWGQYNESRLLSQNVIVVLFGFVDGLDLRSVIFLSAAALIASYAGLLILVRQYLGKLTPITVLVVGVIWFSLADVENALWAFQVSWYLTVFFFVTMLVALLIPNNHRTAWFVIAVLSASAASLTTVQGFLCWPVGAICLLWGKPSGGRARTEIAVWLGALVANLALYLPGYKLNDANTCVAPNLVSENCSITGLLHHPLTAFGFFVALIGNVIPGDLGSGFLHDAARFEVVGAVLLAAALFVLLQSWRQRASSVDAPLPLLLIVFSLLFEVIVTIGRAGTGASGAVSNNRYNIASLILLTGVFIYALGRLRRLGLPMAGRAWRTYLSYLAGFALAILLVVQVTVATGFGLTNGLATSTLLNQDARLLVSFQFGVTEEVACQIYLYYRMGEPQEYRDAVADQLGEFSPGSDHYYHELGPPPPRPACTRVTPPAVPTPPPPRPIVPTPTPPPATHVYVVQPGDTLWALAARYLGNPLRYQELFALNRGMSQVDGFTLVDPNLIYPGMKLLFPADATGLPPGA